MMLADLETVLAAASPAADRAQYAQAIIDGNCLQKATVATRRLSNQRLGELYALDHSVPLFRVLRRLWYLDPKARPQLALLAALARDPLFMASAGPVLSLRDGDDLGRASITEAISDTVGERMNDAVLDKVVRNVSSSWCQAGHLRGRTFKVRQRVVAQPVAIAYALFLGQAVGFRGEDLLASGWTRVLDCTPTEARQLALEANRLDLIAFRSAGNALDFGLERLDPWAGRI